MVQKLFFKTNRPKIFKTLYFWPFWSKKGRDKNFWSKFFLVGIDSEWSKTYFKTKISIWIIFFPLKFFFRDIAVFSKNWWPKNQKFFEFFLVGIDLEWFKTCSKTKISILKILPHWKFFQGHSRFFEKWEIMGPMTTEKEINEKT